MSDEMVKWLLGVLTSTGIIGAAGFLMRDTLAKFFSKTVEHQFDKKLENFKASIRDNERELEEIRSFLVSSRKGRDATFQAKRFEAAEALLKARDVLSQLSMLVEFMKILNVDELLKNGNDQKISEFIKTLIDPFDIDGKLKELGAVDKIKPRLYLSEITLKHFDVYQSIIMQAAMLLKIFTVPLRDKKDLFSRGIVSKAIIELAPITKDSFEKWGEGYAYYWSSYFYEQTLKHLRHELSGEDDLARDTESIQKLALESRRAQTSIRSSLQKVGLSEDLIKTDEGASTGPSVAAEKEREEALSEGLGVGLSG